MILQIWILERNIITDTSPIVELEFDFTLLDSNANSSFCKVKPSVIKRHYSKINYTRNYLSH